MKFTAKNKVTGDVLRNLDMKKLVGLLWRGVDPKELENVDIGIQSFLANQSPLVVATPNGTYEIAYE